MNIACCSTLNDLYFDGFITFFYSLRKHNPWFDYDYYIYSWGELSEKNKDTLKNIYSRFIFKDIKNEDYTNCKYDTTWRTWDINCINRADIFTTEGYDKLIFFDADMIVLKDIKYLFNLDVEFGVVEMTKGTEMDHPGRFDKSIKSFDGGLLVISKKYLNEQTKFDLIKIAKQRNWSSDEPILNTYFDNSKATFMPREYNLLSQEVDQEKLDNARILQFVGSKKPWFPGTIDDRFCKSALHKIPLSFVIKMDLLFKTYYNEAKIAYGL